MKGVFAVLALILFIFSLDWEAVLVIGIIIIIVIFVTSNNKSEKRPQVYAPASDYTISTETTYYEREEYIPTPKPPFTEDLSKYKSIQREAICPNCLGLLPKLPQRKQKCKLCGEQIIVANIPVTDEKVFLNFEDGTRLKSEIEKYWRKLSEKQKIASQYYWWSEEEYYINRRAFFDKFKDANETDFYFACSEQQMQRLLKKKDFFNAKMLSVDLMNKRLEQEEDSGYFYSESAIEDDEGEMQRLYKPSTAYAHARNVVFFDLLDSKKLGLELDVEFQTNIDGCEQRHLNGSRIDIDELLRLKVMPIPCEICTADNMYQCHIIVCNK